MRNEECEESESWSESELTDDLRTLSLAKQKCEGTS